MSTVVGDIVATMGLDTSAWKAGCTSVVTDCQALNGVVQQSMEPARAAIKPVSDAMEEASGSSSDLYRSELALAKGTQLISSAAGVLNPALGQTVSIVGTAIGTLGHATKSWRQLTSSLYAACIAVKAFFLSLGPVGWALIAVGALIAGGIAYYKYATQVDAATQALIKMNEERSKALSEGEKMPSVVAPFTLKEAFDIGTASAESLRSKVQEVEYQVWATGLAVDKYAKMAANPPEPFKPYMGSSLLESPGLHEPSARQQENLREQASLALLNAETERAIALAKQRQLADFAASAQQRDAADAYQAAVSAINAHAYGQKTDAYDTIRATMVAKGCTEQMLQWIDALIQQARQQEKTREIANQATAAIDRLKEKGAALAKTPLDEYIDKLQAIKVAWQQGAISAEQAALAQAMAAKAAGLALTPGQQALIEKANAPIIENKAQQDALEQGKRLQESLMTPLEQYQEQLQKIQALKDRGAISGETERRAQQAALDKYNAAVADTSKPEKQSPSELPRALQINTDEAWKRIASAFYGTDQADAAKETANNTKRSANALEDLAGRDEDFVDLPA
jgi:hypothetical protein